jgi:hypothetical protein
VPKVQLLHRDLIAQFYRSNDDPPVYHYIITRQNSPEIIAWSQCTSLADCQRDAGAAMRYLLDDEASVPPMEFDEDDLEPLAM